MIILQKEYNKDNTQYYINTWTGIFQIWIQCVVRWMELSTNFRTQCTWFDWSAFSVQNLNEYFVHCSMFLQQILFVLSRDSPKIRSKEMENRNNNNKKSSLRIIFLLFSDSDSGKKNIHDDWRRRSKKKNKCMQIK